MQDTSTAKVAVEPVSGQLRIIATTDLHMQLMAYDYFADRQDDTLGLIGLADRIAALRNAPDAATLICDNGDLIQGNPLADWLAANLAPGDTHPMIAALNHLSYDALTLGNHDFDYGPAYLRQVLADAKPAIVSANLQNGADIPMARDFVIITKDVPCDDGSLRPIRIAVTGFAPPSDRDAGNPDDVEIADIIASAKALLPRIAAESPDLTVALCHAGIAGRTHHPGMENAALPLSALPGIDVVVTGHTHEEFPDPDRSTTSDCDPVRGTLCGKPAVMAGAYGNALGIITLDLRWEDGQGWQVNGHQSRLERPVQPDKSPSVLRHQLGQLAKRAHAATLGEMRQPIALTEVHIQSYFAALAPDMGQHLLAAAMLEHARDALGDNTLPLLAATAPFRMGGRIGLGQFIDISPGAITQHDVAAIFPFADRLHVVYRSAAEITLWLERAAAHYNQIPAGTQDEALINPASAGYHYDTLHGLTYDIDLTAPPRFDAQGNEIAPTARRIRALQFQGTDVRESDVFAVATVGFRAKGGGGYPPAPQAATLHRSDESARDILTRYLSLRGVIRSATPAPWRFTPAPGTAAIFETARQAKAHLPEGVSQLPDPGQGPLARYRIAL